MKKMNYKELDAWIENILPSKTFYAKKSVDYPYISISVGPKGEKKIFFSGKRNKKICDVGVFDIKQGGFKGLWERFKTKKEYHANKLEIERLILNYGFPFEEEKSIKEKKAESKVLEADNVKKEESEAKEKNKGNKRNAESKDKLKTIPDDTEVDYPLFVACKNQYNIDKANKIYFKQKIILQTIYMAISIAMVAFFFNSDLFKNSDFLPNAIIVASFMVLFLFGLRKIEDFLEKRHDNLFYEFSYNSHLRDEDHYNGILELMVQKALKKITAYGTRRPLSNLLDRDSDYIPDDVHKLKNEAKIGSLFFAALLSEETRRELLEKYLEDQKMIAREKAIDLLEKIKKEDSLNNPSPSKVSQDMDNKVKDILKARGEQNGE